MKDLHYQAFSSSFFSKHQKILLVVFNLVYKFCPSLFFKSEETADFGQNKIIEVGNNHATCDAGLQYFKKSDLIKTASENPANNHKDRRIYKTILRKIKQGKIKEEMKLLPARKTVFFTDWNYSKMLYNAFKPMWWAMHYWDELVADRFVPSLSFNLSTLEVNPDADPETDTVDGRVFTNKATDETWTSIHDATDGDNAQSSLSSSTWQIRISAGAASSKFRMIVRSFYLFKTSTLTSGAIISNTILSLYGTAKTDNLTCTPNIDIYTTTPETDTGLVVGDYDQIGTTSQTDSPIAYADWSITGYNDFTFNATGIGNVSKVGISKFGARNANYDVANSAPASGSSLASNLDGYYSDYGSNKPKLVVTYTTTQNLTWSGDDTVNLTESNTNIRARFSAVADTINISESTSAIKIFLISVLDTIGLTESINTITGKVVSVFDTINLTENISNVRSRIFSVFDTINLTEVFTGLKSRIISVFDTIRITENTRADAMRLRKGMIHMDSKQQSYPNTLNDTNNNKMRSNQQTYPVPMDEDTK